MPSLQPFAPSLQPHMPSILQPYVSQVLSALLGAHRGQTSVSSWSQVILHPSPHRPYPQPQP